MTRVLDILTWVALIGLAMGSAATGERVEATIFFVGAMLQARIMERPARGE